MAHPLHYKSNLKDIYFNLFEVHKIQDSVLSKGDYSHLDQDTIQEALSALEQLCTQKIAQSFAESDEVPLKLDAQGNVSLPKGLKEAIKLFQDGDWHRFSIPEKLGGFGAPYCVYWSAFEMLVGANPPAALYLFGTFAAEIIQLLGTQSQKQRYVNNILDKRWGATMVLTEPDAGSDVGAGKASAKHIEDDVWEITGVKRFITNGDFDATENIVHMVLARPEGAEVGTKGLSLFLIPKFWVDANGKMGERNGAFCTNLEKKMGIKGSATCEMTFGERMPAKGLLLGNVHDGIRQMFKVIEKARMAVGVKSMSTLSTAYLNALSYSKDRIQGSDLKNAMDKMAPKVNIIKHPDVRRMLMLQKSVAEGMRALCIYCAYLQDLEVLSTHKDEQKQYALMVDFLLPLIKGYNSERAFEILSVSLQCFGGSGYLHDYPIEQYIRDQKIDSLYEGTTHIQALDLIFRKIAKNGAATLNRFLEDIEKTLKDKKAGDHLKEEYGYLKEALLAAQNMMGTMMMKMGESLHHAGYQGNRILIGIAELMIAWLLIRQAEVALEGYKKDPLPFYEGKIASARFYCANVLPYLSAYQQMIEKGDLSLDELREEAF